MRALENRRIIFLAGKSIRLFCFCAGGVGRFVIVWRGFQNTGSSVFNKYFLCHKSPIYDSLNSLSHTFSDWNNDSVTYKCSRGDTHTYTQTAEREGRGTERERETEREGGREGAQGQVSKERQREQGIEIN